jgi:pectate lyase
MHLSRSICFPLGLVAAFACGSERAGDAPGQSGGGSPAAGATAASGQAAGGTASAGASNTGGAPLTGGAGAATGGSAGTGAGGALSGAAGASIGGSVAGGGGGGGMPSDNDCNTPPAPSELVGWATRNGGTTGGGNDTPVVVKNASELTAQLKGSDAKVIHLEGNVEGSFAVGSNKTLIGVCGAQIHGHVGLSGSTNVIIRNLKLVGNNCQDSPQDCSGGADAMTLSGGAKNVWIDHLDISDGSDGNLDITQGSDFVTVSWTKFSYSSKRSDPDAGASGHRFSNLIGSSDTEPLDVGHLNVTYHHCWWAQNVDQRMPRTRRGQIHVFNNLFTASGNSYCTNAGQDAKLLVQNNVYAGVSSPLQVSANGDMKAEGNDFSNSTGNKSASGNGFTPPYQFELDATATLQATLEALVGPHD